MDEIALKTIAVIVIMLIAIGLIFAVLTNRIDLKAPFEKFVTFRKHHKPDVQIKQMVPSRILLDGNSQSGNIGLLVYDLKVVPLPV